MNISNTVVLINDLFFSLFFFCSLQQPRPVGCSSCNSKGHVECKWCAGTGFFILGDNMLCQVPSRNTSCVICSGKVSNNLIRLLNVFNRFLCLPKKYLWCFCLYILTSMNVWFFFFCCCCGFKGSACCSDCKGTGFRAKWLEKPPVPL